MPNHEETLSGFVSWLNNWATSGSFARMLGMFHAQGRMVVGGAYGTYRCDSRPEIEAFLQQNKPGDAIELTHTADTPIGALGTFRWTRQPEDIEAGTITIELVNDQIIRFAWEFLPTTRHPVPFIQGAALQAPPPAPAPAAPSRPTAPAAPAPATPASRPATPTPTPPAGPQPAGGKPVFL